jgi:hypothetical protein
LFENRHDRRRDISKWYERFRVSDYGGALQRVELQIAKEPDKAVHHYNRGDILRKLYRDDEAIASYLRAKHLALESGDEDIADAVDNFVWPSRDDPNQFVFVFDVEWENLRRSEIILGEPCQHPGCVHPRIALSIYCPWHHYEMIQGKPCPYGDNA